MDCRQNRDEMIKVQKASGEYQSFSEEKIRKSLRRAGISKEVAEKILVQLRKKIYEGIPTNKIHLLVSQFLNKEKFYLSSKYQLKRAIAQMGPTGYPFEKFFAGILRHLNYRALNNQVLEGKCSLHEVDVVAQKEGEKILVECKFHNQFWIKTDVKTALYVWARFLDLKEKHGFTQVWLATNTKLTSQAISYCRCVGIKAVSWSYKDEWSLQKLVEKSRLFPITILTALNEAEKQKLFNQGIVFCRDLEQHLNLIPENKKEPLRKELSFILGGV